jgi:hypothetical protein
MGTVRKVIVEYLQDFLMVPHEKLGQKQAAWRVDPGFRVDHTLFFSLDTNIQRYDEARTRDFYKKLTDRLRGSGGVNAVSMSSSIPFSTEQATRKYLAEGAQPRTSGDMPNAFSYKVDDYFFPRKGHVYGLMFHNNILVDADFTGFPAAWFHHELGLNVAFPVLPLHGPRKMGIRTGDGFPHDVGDALAFIAAHDVVGYTYAVESVLASFETREEYLEDVPVADTVLVLQALAGRRGLAAELSSALLPGGG